MVIGDYFLHHSFCNYFTTDKQKGMLYLLKIIFREIGKDMENIHENLIVKRGEVSAVYAVCSQFGRSRSIYLFYSYMYMSRFFKTWKGSVLQV